MATGKKGMRVKGRKPQKMRNQRTPKLPKAVAPGAAAAVRAHADMIMDPCGAHLAPCVSQNDAGVQVKVAATFMVGGTAASTGGYLVYAPQSNTIANADLTNSGTSSTLAFTATAGRSPGQAILATNAQDQRAVGACIEILPMASESARAGWMSYGVVDYRSAGQGLVATPDAISTMLPVTTKVGDGVVAIKWFPGEQDHEYTQQGTAMADTNNIVFVWGGVPAATGFRIRITTIFEYRSTATVGIVENALDVPLVGATFDDVRRYVLNRDANWWWSTGKTAFMAAKKVASFTAGAMALI